MDKLLLNLAAFSLLALPLQASEGAPYAGFDAREIASLSAEDIEDLLAGRGWGFALPAELNGYPGPTHVLELAEELGPDAAQRAEIEAIRAAMEADARDLGRAFIAAEAELSAAFRSGDVDSAKIAALSETAADIEARLRARHLEAHLEVTPLMTRHQKVTYARLRGYGGDGAHDGQDHGNH